MKILFIDNFSFNFGIASISSVLKQSGHDVELLYYTFSKMKGIDIYRNPSKYYSFNKIADEIIGRKPDIIGFSVLSSNYMFYKNTAEAIRRRTDIPILTGGVFPTMSPDFFIENTCCDFVFRGEAEPVIVELIEKIALGKYYDVPNIVYREKGGTVVHNEMSSFVDDLDALPFYDKEVYPGVPFQLNMSTSRGCVNSCSYCSSGKYTRLTVRGGAGKVRKRSVDSIIKEIKQALRKWPYKEISFWDDFFITTPKWLSEFVEKYSKEINLPYNCIAFPAVINNEVASLLAGSGCNVVCMGFQTANEEYKKNVLRRRETKKQVAKAINHLEEHGVKYSLDHIFNLPGETKEHIEESLDFFINNKVKWVSIYFLNYYPDSDITKYSYDNGFIGSEQFSKIMKNELIGDQAFKGTIVDKKKSKEQVQYALLFRLINLLPAKWLKRMLKNDIQKRFPTNKYLYYSLSLLTLFKAQGFRRVLTFVNPYFKFRKNVCE
ncbi:B12-binding domain-containing radical SAM protein [bacterium]|nr:B12-binding domain-containing radical SAM protein [bacterium]